ncbi:MAG: hypothetical protein HC939_06030 [Pleurocapsa sp. SU_5_0]|nr:hypothetical protein [Pleurocapsa sp. SU_5_0]
MNMHTLRSNIRKSRNAFIGRVLNTQKNLNYLKDLESWGSLEIVNSSEAYIEYRLI